MKHRAQFRAFQDLLRSAGFAFADEVECDIPIQELTLAVGLDLLLQHCRENPPASTVESDDVLLFRSQQIPEGIEVKLARKNSVAGGEVRQAEEARLTFFYRDMDLAAILGEDRLSGSVQRHAEEFEAAVRGSRAYLAVSDRRAHRVQLSVHA